MAKGARIIFPQSALRRARLCTLLVFAALSLLPRIAASDPTFPIPRPVPPNDSFSASALPTRIAGLEFEFQTETATVEPGEPPLLGATAARTVWWRWTPAANQPVRFKAVGNLGALPVEIFTGTTLASLARVAHNDGRTDIPGLEGIVPLTPIPGVTYSIRVSDPRPSTSPHPLIPIPNRTDLKLQVDAGDTPLPGLIMLSTAGGTPQSDGTMKWEVFARLIDLDGNVATNPDYTYQFYIGSTLSTLRPYTPGGAALMGLPMVDDGTRNGPELAGAMSAGFATFPSIPSGQKAYVQVRAWNRYRASTYEAARASGSPIARSEPFQVTLGSELSALAILKGMRDFQLQPGIPNFSPGFFRFAGFVSGRPVWELEASPGFTHAIEILGPSGSWDLFTTLVNTTGKISFADEQISGAQSAIYRARILD